MHPAICLILLPLCIMIYSLDPHTLFITSQRHSIANTLRFALFIVNNEICIMAYRLDLKVDEFRGLPPTSPTAGAMFIKDTI